MTYGILLVLALFMRFGPDIPFRRMLNDHLVARPVAFLLSHERHQYIFMVVAPALLLLGGELVLLFGPELILAYAADMALYIDLVLVAAASASWRRTRAMIGHLRHGFGRNRAALRKRTGATPRSRRTQRNAPKVTAANDDDGDGADAGFVTARQPRAMAA